MSGVTIEPVAGRYGLLEGPHWDETLQKLFFVDIFGQKILRYDPVTGKVTSIFLENGPVGVAAPVDGQPGKFVAGCLHDLVLVDWDSEKNVSKYTGSVLVSVESDRIGTRFNDGKIDSSGRFWGGTMAIEKDGALEPDRGSFYSIGNDLVPKMHIETVSVSNGIAWSKENDIMYYIDSLTYQIFAFDYNQSTASISNKRVIFDLKKNNITGLPDGMTIDTNGTLWVAVYLGGCVLNIDPKTGKLIRKIDIPAKNVTSVAFGGTNLDVLYVTTNSVGLKEDELKEQPYAGFLFAVKGLNARGYKAHSFKMTS